MAAVGLAPREVRLVILTIGLVGPASPACRRRRRAIADPRRVLDVALGLIAVLATITTVQRILVTLKQASQPAAGVVAAPWSRST